MERPNIDWKPSRPVFHLRGTAVCRLEAVLSPDVVIEFWTDFWEGEVTATFVVHEEGKHYTTDSTGDWPVVEKYLPREFWPVEIYLGGGDCGPLVAQAMEQEREENLQLNSWGEEEETDE